MVIHIFAQYITVEVHCNDLFTAWFHAKTVGNNDSFSSNSLEQVISILFLGELFRHHALT